MKKEDQGQNSSSQPHDQQPAGDGSDSQQSHNLGHSPQPGSGGSMKPSGSQPKIDTPASNDLGAKIGNFIGVCIDTLGDGFSPMNDIPPLVAGALKDVFPALQELDAVKAEWAQDKISVLDGLWQGAMPILRRFM